jgi:hypothetical protein
MARRFKEVHIFFLLIVGLLAWIVPGGGHLVLKEKKHAIIIFVTITLTFCTGLYIGSVGVIDPVRAKPWYIAQIMNSPAVLVLGYLNTDWILFSIGLENQSDLNNEIISGTLQEQFRNHGISLSDEAGISTGPKGYTWMIKDTQQAYRVHREQSRLNIYPDYTVYGRPNEIGQIYTSIAGLLNLLCIVNAVYWGHLRRTETEGE